MATQLYKTVQGNTAPPIQITCKRGSTIIDLTNCTVEVIIVKGSTTVNTGHQSATVTSATGGIIQYMPQTGDFATAGTYKADVKVTYGDGTTEILYDQLKIKARKTAAA